MELTRPLCVLDIESTGVDPTKDRIITLSITKISPPHAAEVSHDWMFNPGMPIPPEATEIHHITDGDVANCPPFKDHAIEVADVLTGSDWAGFGISHFDAPLIWEEFYRAGITFDVTGINIIDCGILFKILEPRDLTAAVKFYCKREHTGAHGAKADVAATVDVLYAQINRYPELIDLDVPALARFSQFEDNVDLAGIIFRNKDGEPCYGTKRNRGVRCVDDPGYGEWMLRTDFPTQTKIVLEKILNGEKV
jgi:DNA polymerase-3 subunit epsilon